MGREKISCSGWVWRACATAVTVTSGRPNPLHHGFPGRLQRVRRERDLVRAHLSTAAGLGVDTVRALEAAGRVPRVETVCRLADALKINPAWLAYGVEPREAMAQSEALSFGERLILARQARGLSQRQLGDMAEMTGASVSALERQGNVPDIGRAERLAKALGVPAAWLAFGVGEGLG